MRVRLIGSSDLNEFGAAESHHIRQAERPADLDKLAARDDNFLAVSNGVEDNAGGRGIIIDHGSRLGAGQLLQKPLDIPISL